MSVTIILLGYGCYQLDLDGATKNVSLFIVISEKSPNHNHDVKKQRYTVKNAIKRFPTLVTLSATCNPPLCI